MAGYATFSGYNALGQPKTITYANGIMTTYDYYSTNNRLKSIVTRKGNLVAIQDVTYTQYDNKGNIKNLTNAMVNSNKIQRQRVTSLDGQIP